MRRIALLASAAALGLAAGIGDTANPAQPWDIANLPAPYTVSSYTDVSVTQGCRTFYHSARDDLRCDRGRTVAAFLT